MELQAIRNTVYDIKEKGYKEGLTIKDYRKLKKILDSMNKTTFEPDNEEYVNLYCEINEIIQSIHYSGILHSYGQETYIYVKEHAFLLPLVLANNENNKIKVGYSNYTFLCQFHVEKTPSMRVSDFENFLHCFGCGIDCNVIKYVMEYEGLPYKKAIQLLAKIYLYDIKKENKELDSLAKKYQDIILGDEYLQLLETGKEKLKKKYGSIFNGKDIDEVYDERYKVIDRIKQKTYDPNFPTEHKKGIMFLYE